MQNSIIPAKAGTQRGGAIGTRSPKQSLRDPNYQFCKCLLVPSEHAHPSPETPTGSPNLPFAERRGRVRSTQGMPENNQHPKPLQFPLHYQTGTKEPPTREIPYRHSKTHLDLTQTYRYMCTIKN